MTERIVLVLMISASCSVSIAALIGYAVESLPTSKLFSTCSGLLALSSLYQLRISGWFEKVMALYGDEEKFPFGPPSHITRQIIDNPDQPILTAIRNYLFLDPNCGAHLAVASILAALIAAWS